METTASTPKNPAPGVSAPVSPKPPKEKAVRVDAKTPDPQTRKKDNQRTTTI